ncbi:hypothetical protein ACGFIV_15085 [Sphaerisporangium sp. NPDC049003]|uniref:hypothetical protein n=1 Tax=Sphaerisporangium sp. NPDC049003 TaxID=3364517 RepID=UPI00371CF8AC
MIARDAITAFCFSLLVCCSDETSVADTRLPVIAAGCRLLRRLEADGHAECSNGYSQLAVDPV